MVKDTVISEQLKEEQWEYFRPGFYPLQARSIVPAMVCISDFPYANHDEPNIQFVLVKASCHLKEWQDALFVSEQDFQQARTKLQTDKESKIKMETLMAEFMANGYLPLTKVKTDLKLENIH